MTLQTKQIETVIHDISEFFTDWVGGRCPGDAETFRKNALDRLSDGLVAIFPGGRSFGKNDFESAVGRGCGHERHQSAARCLFAAGC